VPAKPHSVVETPEYLRRAKRLFDDAERIAIVDFLARDPTAGDIVPGTGGARKLRWAMAGRGKSGGARIVTYYGGADVPLFLLSAFGKNEKSDLSASERAELKTALSALSEVYRWGAARYVQSQRKHS
jgi:hypothetical protein